MKNETSNETIKTVKEIIEENIDMLETSDHDKEITKIDYTMFDEFNDQPGSGD